MKKASLKILALILIFVMIISAMHYFHPLVNQLFIELQSVNGIEALWWICIIYIVSNLLLLPFGLPLNLFAGALWGTLYGGILMNILATAVAIISFYIARWASQFLLNDFFLTNAKLRKFKEVFNRYDWQFIFLARINPIVPFNLSNYLFGAIPELSFKHYITATIAANLLPCLAFAAIGSALKTVSLYNQNLHQIILQVGVALLLISFIIIIKMLRSATTTPTSVTIKDKEII
jgi:uncharacterized membrane protein YdjX (TVP38/TMEM64 family)